MTDLTLLSESRCFGGLQRTYEHASSSCNCLMRFATYLPPAAEHRLVPSVYWLSGLTCTEENFSIKSGAQRYAAELEIALIIPDTSPRGVGLPGENEHLEVGNGAGFYVDATQPPWSAHYQMYTYVSSELVNVVNANLPLDPDRKSISGHSMGGHGALLLASRKPHEYRSISAFAPICSVIRSAWGQHALNHYLGPDKNLWLAYDACESIRRQPNGHIILVDQGNLDPYLNQLQPAELQSACKASGQELQYRKRKGYDHSYFFVGTFIEEHLRFHAQALI